MINNMQFIAYKKCLKTFTFKKVTKKRIPDWYKLFLERKIKKLETALRYLDCAEDKLNNGFIYTAKAYIDIVIKENNYDRI